MTITKLDPSLSPPAGLKPSEVPQFVSIGFDDNEMVDELIWISDFVKELKNSDGSPVRFSFYNNGKFTNAVSTWKRLYTEGHEIGDHSYSHNHGQKTNWELIPPKYEILMDSNEWKKEIDKNREVYNKAEITDVTGFRTPFLEFTDETFKAITDRGFAYDCSIEEGYQPELTPRNFYWPYTLDNGSPGDNIFSMNIPGRKPVGSYPGLWEMPVYLLEIPDDSLSTDYNFPKGLRDKIDSEKKYIKESNWKITGFDWNLWYTDDGRPFLNPDEVLAILKYNLDLHLNGNRAPFMFGAHIDLYTSREKQETLENFIKYALSNKEVIVTPTRKILEWIQSPKVIV